MAYTYDPIFAVDPNNSNNAAKNASITIFDPADPTQAPVAIQDPTGSPLPNPLTVDAAGMGPAFQHPTLARVGWKGAGFTGYFTSYEGMLSETVAAKEAAEAAIGEAQSAAAERVTAAVVNESGKLILTKATGSIVDAGSVIGPSGPKGDKGVDGANVLPTEQAIEQAFTTDGPVKTTLSNTIVTLAGARSLPATRTGTKVYERHNDGYNFTASSMRKWRNALAKAEKGLGYARLNCYGDSITVGFPGSGGDYRLGAWSTILRGKIDARYGSAGTGIVFPWSAEADSRLTGAGAAWTPISGNHGAFQGSAVISGDTAKTKIFTPEMPVDGFKVYYWTTTGTNTFDVSVDGGAPVTVDGSLAPIGEIRSYTVTGLTLGTHAIKVQPKTGVTYLWGFEGTVGAKGVRVSRVAKGGSVAGDLTASNGTAGDSLTTAFNMIPPDLSIIAFGHNEYIQSIPVATYKANIQTLITRAKVTGSVILQTQIPNGTPRVPAQNLYDAALYELADSNDVALMDMGIRWGDKASNDPLMYADNTHPTNQGLADMAAAYWGVIPLG